MVKVKKDLTGKQFGKLTVLYQVEDYINPQGKHRSKWHCLCDCGNETDIVGTHLVSGNTISCGCYKSKRLGEESKKYNDFKIVDEITIIYTSKNEEILVDTKSFNDIPKIKEICWCIGENGYVVGRDCKIGKLVFLHNIIMNPNHSNNEYVDHIYGKKFDNRISQLRIATYTQNNQNKGVRSDNTSGVIGVYWSSNRNKWYAQITVDNKTKSLGYYTKLNDAIQIRLKAEKEHFKEFSPQKHLFEQYGID